MDDLSSGMMPPPPPSDASALNGNGVGLGADGAMVRFGTRSS
jgi:hypothetical protein